MSFVDCVKSFVKETLNSPGSALKTGFEIAKNIDAASIFNQNDVMQNINDFNSSESKNIFDQEDVMQNMNDFNSQLESILGEEQTMDDINSLENIFSADDSAVDDFLNQLDE